ncbi:hypothetical protein BDM02DRAFT_562703 [Thelephora ganbajun]|uniref:Uncharacterized protein n=1 Tax=Thelephora ganbajun TaxID=370292 RepID=A0ACB6ZQ51_THEGA|nr:hypothetical protein BDM02DRAFT_562703 [Thelephora ganbajun]
MVFSQLPAHEKDAFFSLLDEYFESRPDLLKNIAKSQGVKSVANAAHDAFKNPTTRNSAIDTVRSGLNSSRASWNTKQEASPESAEEKAHNGPGRVAAAAASLMSSPRFGGSPTPTSTGPPKPSPPPVQRRESTVGPLPSTKTFGSDVDLSSTKGFFTSIRNSSKSSNQPLATASSFLPPPPSGIQKKQFTPPPVRRVISDSSPTSSSSTPTPPAPPPRKKEEPAGEWAEVLYDFTGDQSGDLNIKESQRVLIVDRSDGDWWTVELNGKRGLVPASYVKVL